MKSGLINRFQKRSIQKNIFKNIDVNKIPGVPSVWLDIVDLFWRSSLRPRIRPPTSTTPTAMANSEQSSPVLTSILYQMFSSTSNFVWSFDDKALFAYSSHAWTFSVCGWVCFYCFYCAGPLTASGLGPFRATDGCCRPCARRPNLFLEKAASHHWLCIPKVRKESEREVCAC